jgi:hypothetical protein
MRGHPRANPTKTSIAIGEKVPSAFKLIFGFAIAITAIDLGGIPWSQAKLTRQPGLANSY